MSMMEQELFAFRLAVLSQAICKPIVLPEVRAEWSAMLEFLKAYSG